MARSNSKRLRDYLVQLGVPKRHIPWQWTPELLAAAYEWIGKETVNADLKPKRKRGRPKGTQAPDDEISAKGHQKRKERDKHHPLRKTLDLPFLAEEKRRRKKLAT
jgi:hypothetical protein